MSFPLNPDDLRRVQELIRAVVPQIQAAQIAYRDLEKTMGATVRQIASWYADQVQTLQPVIERAATQYRALETEAHRRAVPILRRRGWFGVAPYLSPLEVTGDRKVVHRHLALLALAHT